MEISLFNNVISIVAIGLPALFLSAIVLFWVLERTIFKFVFCEGCKKEIEHEMNRRGYQGDKK